MREIDEILSTSHPERDECDFSSFEETESEEEFNKFFDILKRKAQQLGREEGQCVSMSRDALLDNWHRIV